MWLIFGGITIVASVINIYRYKKGKDYKLFMAIALSFTSLTLASEYKLVYDWVKAEDWSALLDVIPSMTIVLSLFTIVSILLNTAPLFLE